QGRSHEILFIQQSLTDSQTQAIRKEVTVFNRVCAMQLLGGHGNARSLWEKEILPRMKVRRQLH
ncbi:TPA: hypothetical protein ACI6QB_005508, partial [Klebsiella quasipneumoniae]